MAQARDGSPLFSVKGSPKYIVQWLQVIPYGVEDGVEEGDEEAHQCGYVRTACRSLEEIRAELRDRWDDPCLRSFLVYVRGEDGLYDFMKDAAWMNQEMREFIEKAKPEG